MTIYKGLGHQKKFWPIRIKLGNLLVDNLLTLQQSFFMSSWATYLEFVLHQLVEENQTLTIGPVFISLRFCHVLWNDMIYTCSDREIQKRVLNNYTKSFTFGLRLHSVVI